MPKIYAARGPSNAATDPPPSDREPGPAAPVDDPGTGAPMESVEATADGTEHEAPDYASMTVAALREEITRRNTLAGGALVAISTRGTKAELVARLEESDRTVAAVGEDA